MARDAADGGGDSFLSGSDWFVFKFDKQQAGLSGLAFDEGRFGVFGYVTGGLDALGQRKQRNARLKAAAAADGSGTPLNHVL